ncbi:MAG: histidine phosphatase family protein [Chloroflexi bacterium]|nr:histidine phosphatase family protein [Chloroflexota bacterium]
MHVYLIRHAAVTPRPDLPGSRWYLSPDGRAAAEKLGEEPYWGELRGIHTSVEPKAVATAQRIAAANELPIRIERDLREVQGRAWVETGYAEQVHAYLSGNTPEGWEPLDDARARVRSCIDGIVGRHTDLSFGIISHGIVLTLYLSDVMELGPEEATSLWKSIRFPDVAVFDPAKKRFEREFGG